MNRLNLYLSDKIKATFTRKVEDTDFFVINKDFYIHRLLCDKKEMIFKEETTSSNFKVILFEKISGMLEIEYEGILDGTTGKYPYVKEKTSDDFYILRHETVYYPCFIRVDSEDYIQHLIEPREEDMFEVSVHVEDQRCAVSNLKEVNGWLRGFNPTIVIGNYHEYKSFFGAVYYEMIEKEKLQRLEKIIYDTNQFMNRYKKAKIQDYKIIIIPEGYGSFVLEDTMFVTKEGCEDAQQLIHELIHTHWNPKCIKRSSEHVSLMKL